MTTPADWDLVARARAGDRAAFAALVRRYHMPVIHFCQRMTGSRQDAEDLAQESFIRLHRYLAQLRPDARFSTVLFGIARNLTLNFLRDSRRRGRGITETLENVFAVEAAQRNPDERARMREIEMAVTQGIEELTPDHREVLLLRELHGMDYESIARVTGSPKGTVKSRIARAREHLRQKLLAAGGDEL